MSPKLSVSKARTAARTVGLSLALSVSAAALAETPHVDTPGAASGETVPVAWNTFVRAESDRYFKTYVDKGAFGSFLNVREPTPIDQQKVIRMNRDTLYSAGIFDLEAGPVTIVKPDTGPRFQSMQVLSQDQYTISVDYDPGEYTLTKDKVGTRYVMVLFRTLVDAEDPEDLKAVHTIQDQISARQEATGHFTVPNWDQATLNRLRDALNVLASTMKDSTGCFGTKEEVEPTKYIMCAAFGWGGNPTKAAIYETVIPARNDGKTPYELSVRDVPVKGFWSISVYNAKGFFQKNRYNAYSLNNLTAKTAEDGSVTVHFGGDPAQPNFLPIVDGWSYVVRLYRPGEEMLSGAWHFPEATIAAQ